MEAGMQDTMAPVSTLPVAVKVGLYVITFWMKHDWSEYLT
jgi:hypothetical protein